MRKPRILVVDDEEIIRATLSRDLAEAGFDVATAFDVASALDYLRQEPVDLVITDLVMEDGDGIELLKGVRTLRPEVSVMILTGFGDLNSAIEAVRHGADDYLLKPYTFEDLARRVHRCLDQQEMARRIRLYEDILPVCCMCRKIRDDEGREPGTGPWMSMEEYLARKAGVSPSHSYCPECLEKAARDLPTGKK